MKLNFKNTFGMARSLDLRSGLLDFFSGSPRKYWPLFLIATFILLLASASFSVYLFIIFNKASGLVVEGELEIRGPKINQALLEEVVKSVEDREADFQKALTSPAPADPSL